jgi:AcrR family transcriptional regulator
MSAARTTAPARAGAPARRLAPAGRSVRGLPPDLRVADQRRRLLAAFAAEVPRRGYDELSVEHVVRRAGVSRRTVYELFDGKADLFAAAHAEAFLSMRRLLRRAVRAAGAGASSWPDLVRAVLAALLDGATAAPDRALLLAAPSLVAGPHVGACHSRLRQAFGPCLRAAAPTGAPLSLPEAALGGLTEPIAGRILAGESDSLPALAPSLSTFLLACFPGPGASP